MTSQNRRLTMKDKQAKYPQLRFKGFTDAWVQRNLSELLQERNHQIEPNDEYELMSFAAGTGVTPKGERYDRSALVTNDSKKYKVTEFGDFIYSSNNLETGSIGFNKTGKALISPVYSIFYSTENADSRFIGLLSSQKNFIHSMVRYRQGVVYGQWRIHESDFLKIAVFTPKLDEQNKIIEFFERFDKLIAANQRKLDLLKEQKKGYLQKMFPKNGAKVPELRFAGFADAWEQRKLSDLTERVTRKNKNNESSRPLTISAQDGLIDQNDFFDKQIASRDISGYFLVKNGEFAYNKSYSNGYPWGAIKRLDKYDMGVLSTLYIIFRPTNVSSQFLVSYYDTTRWYKEVAKNAAEGARNHGLLNIAPTDFFSTVLLIPNSIEEQQKIGSFFKQLDDTITLHQRKLEKLQELKKGYLQKMFC
ncbi:type I site-specific deoxyribonuclease specificity subunit [Secundilactobacillus similis DSM 23365 = JCM 2765]|uniref:Type I site-specific deoxyribonuclease specificity subunit n=2 Tax=Secundilactobacillus similis TaxID=414682 RepID=A0A0R2EP16_9LACO|nr:type I site-specific deoxyribonuclease specificity subunit [Secundilactobacillus similis DSM 23365 = JCM 2765]